MVPVKINPEVKNEDFINGHRDHIHILISVNQEQNISNIMRLIKGESSHWINKENLTYQKFGWADEYFAVSVSESHVNRVRDYIKNQDRHHQRIPWLEEHKRFMDGYRFKYD